ncbi:MAG: 50S ribosomal protein L9 [bacterium]|nr:50S ribosomal protein L9 [bacterium]MCY3924977.1 50S ribosomal protein L9 [bacterium]
MKVVLRSEVPSLGRRGDVCDVADGYAQNYLIPRGLAMRATRGSVRQAEAMRRRRELADAAVLSGAQEMAERLAGRSIRVVARAGEAGRLYGSVNAVSLAAAIAEQERVVLAPEMLGVAEPIKQTGTYSIPVTPHPEVVTEVTVEVVAAT